MSNDESMTRPPRIVNVGSSSLSEPQIRTRRPKVLFIGDSITWGWVPPHLGQRGKPFSFAERIRKLDIHTTNVGRGGTKSTDWVPGAGSNAFDAAFHKFGPHVRPWDWAVVMLGTNDAIPPCTSPQQYGWALQGLVGVLTNTICDRVVLMTPPFRSWYQGNQQDEFLHLFAYFHEVWKIGQHSLVTVLDINALFRAPESTFHWLHPNRTELFEEDPTHPNADGHGLIYNALKHIVASQ